MKSFKRLTLLIIAGSFILGVCCCSVDRPEETQECPYEDSASNASLRDVAFTRSGNIDQNGKLISQVDPHQKYLGVDISHGDGQGDCLYTDSNGNKYSFETYKAVITNDTTLPIRIKIDLSKEYAYPSPYNEQKFKLFLLPKKEIMQEQIDHDNLSEESKKLLTPLSSSVTLNNGLWDPTNRPISKELENYIPCTLDQTIDPNGKFTVTIGMLVDTKYISPGQLALITKGHRYPFFSHYCDINQSMSASKSSALFLGLDFFRTAFDDRRTCYLVIPCGEITFFDK